MESRTIFIGDIHGCYDEFKALLKKLEINKNDRVFLAGDIINKGPKSYKVLNFLYKNQNQFKVVLGNHDIAFLKWIELGKSKSHKIFYNMEKKILKKGKKKIINYLRNLPLFIEEKDFILIHSGLIPGKKLEEHSALEITNIREWEGKPWYEYYNGKKKVIYGHWALDGLRIRKNTIGLDSGCVYGKALTAYILETGEIIQEQAKNIYVNVYVKQDYFRGFKNKIFASKNPFFLKIKNLFTNNENK